MKKTVSWIRHAFMMIVLAPSFCQGAWSIETVDATSSDRGQCLTTALDPSGRLHIAYRSGTGKVFHARWSGSKWIISQIDQAVGGGDVGLAVDRSGNAHISYYDNGNVYDSQGYLVGPRADLKYAKWNGTGWSKQTVVTDHAAGCYNSLALDSSGRPHICYSYENLPGAGAWFEKLEYVRWTGSNWEREPVDAAGSGAGGGSGLYCRLVIDKSDVPRIAYRCESVIGYDNNEHLRYAVRANTGGWLPEEVTHKASTGEISFDLAADGTPNIVVSSSGIRHLARNAAGWTSSFESKSGIHTGLIHSMAVDGNGVPGIAQVGDNFELVFHSKRGTSWTSSVITAKVVTDVSMQYGPGNTPLVAFYQPGTGLLLARQVSPEIAVQQPAGSNLTDGTSKKSFGTVKVGSKGPAKTFTIKNMGSSRLANLAVSRRGAHKADFMIAGPLKTSLAAGESTTFKITFKPKAKGTRTAAIRIASNDADENPFDIVLKGRATAP